MAMEVSLLDVLALCADCDTISELRLAGSWQRAVLARCVERLEAEQAPLREWNDALSYLSGCGPQLTSEQARAELLASLAPSRRAG